LGIYRFSSIGAAVLFGALSVVESFTALAGCAGNSTGASVGAVAALVVELGVGLIGAVGVTAAGVV